MTFQCTLVSLLFITHLSAQAQIPEIHKKSIVVDLHSDVLLQVLRGADISKKLPHGQVDLIRLREGGVDVLFFAVWPDPGKYMPDQMYRQAVYMIDQLNKILASNQDEIMLGLSVPDVLSITARGKLVACIGIEGGTVIENDLSKLDSLYNLGARYLGLTWNDSPGWATSAKDEYKGADREDTGLTDFGREVVWRMNELGMIIDLSHAGEQTVRDVLAVTRKPVIASHSDVYQLRHHYRNLKDWQIKAIAVNGGVIGINFYPAYLDYAFAAKMEEALQENEAYLDSMRQVYTGNYLGYREYRSQYLRSVIKNIPTVKTVVDHIDYIVNLVGEDYVAIGSDFDGISIAPEHLEDISRMPNLTAEMIRRGYSEERISKILGLNFLRVMQAQKN